MKRIVKIHLAVIMACLLLLSSVIGAAAYMAEGGELSVAYYATMAQAFTDINADKWGANSLAQGEDAPIRTTLTNDGYVIEVQQDYTESATVIVNTAKPIHINFGRYVMNSGNTGLDIISGSVTITAENEGGIIARGTTRARAAQLRAGTLTVNGGRYETYSSGGQACCFLSAGQLTIEKASLHAEDPTGKARCLQVNAGAVTELEQSVLYAGVQYGAAIAVYAVAGSRSTMRNCIVDAYSNYIESGSASPESASIGISNYGELALESCSVFGAHSGVQSLGKLSIVGGSYSGYGHGGLYISGESNVAYISRATLSAVLMPAGYTATNTFNDAGMYIGGSGGKNIRVYMDNCWVDSNKRPIVLRSSSDETNNALYISNTILGCSKTIRVDDKHHVYYGSGNQFNFPSQNATQTDEDYGAIISENMG